MINLHILLDPVTAFWKCHKNEVKQDLFDIFDKEDGLIRFAKMLFKNLEFCMVVK